MPAIDIALENKLDMDAAGLVGSWLVRGVDGRAGDKIPPCNPEDVTNDEEWVGVAAISCSILLRMGSLLISAVLCIHVPVLISNSCFLRQRMHTQII